MKPVAGAHVPCPASPTQRSAPPLAGRSILLCSHRETVSPTSWQKTVLMRSIRHTLYSFRVQRLTVDAEGCDDPCCLVNIRLIETYSQENSQIKLSRMRRNRENAL